MEMRAMRPPAHQVETLARRKVPLALPPEWEDREVSGRDYGIDMIVEPFESGDPTGTFLLLQIKGIQKTLECPSSGLRFDVPVQNLRYSELFIAPVLLAVCQVHVDPPAFFYLWLQEYIRIVLDCDKPGWRRNRRTVCVKIPVENRMPGGEERLRHIAKYPRRLFDWVQVARIQHELQYMIQPDTDLTDWTNIEKAVMLLEEVRDLRGTFGDRTWAWARSMREDFLEPAIRVGRILSRGRPYTSRDVQSVRGRLAMSDGVIEDQDETEVLLRHQLACAVMQLGSFLATANDHELSRTLWAIRGDHDF